MNATVQFQIEDDLELPEVKRAGGVRGKGPFASAVDSLNVGQGFRFADKRELKKLYPTFAPKKFDGKKFTVRFMGEKNEAGEQVAGEDGSFAYAVKRIS